MQASPEFQMDEDLLQFGVGPSEAGGGTDSGGGM